MADILTPSTLSVVSFWRSIDLAGGFSSSSSSSDASESSLLALFFVGESFLAFFLRGEPPSVLFRLSEDATSIGVIFDLAVFLASALLGDDTNTSRCFFLVDAAAAAGDISGAFLGGRPRFLGVGVSIITGGAGESEAFLGGRPRLRGGCTGVVASIIIMGDLILGGRPRGRPVDPFGDFFVDDGSGVVIIIRGVFLTSTFFADPLVPCDATDPSDLFDPSDVLARRVDMDLPAGGLLLLEGKQDGQNHFLEAGGTDASGGFKQKM